jgi:L-fucose isomerase-like protein
MQQACLLSIGGAVASESTVEGLGTRVRVLPSMRFGDEFKRTPVAEEVKEVAARFRKEARKIVEPSDADVVDAARASVALKKVVTDEKADALMMDCLGGIQKRFFPPPCMGYMRLRDEGIPAGCQNELAPALTMMLVQHLFDKPGFQQNPAFDTERNLYYGSHCTSPTRLEGIKSDPQPYILRSHAEAGIGTVPEVIWPVGQEVTMAAYHPGKKPTMIVYTGKVVGRCDTPPAGGCRSNLTMTINELADVTGVKGTHQTIFAGNHAKQLKAFCQLYGITVVV